MEEGKIDETPATPGPTESEPTVEAGSEDGEDDVDEDIPTQEEMDEIENENQAEIDGIDPDHLPPANFPTQEEIDAVKK